MAGQAVAVHFVVQIDLKTPLMRMDTSDEVMNAGLSWLQMAALAAYDKAIELSSTVINLV